MSGNPYNAGSLEGEGQLASLEIGNCFIVRIRICQVRFRGIIRDHIFRIGDGFIGVIYHSRAHQQFAAVGGHSAGSHAAAEQFSGVLRGSLPAASVSSLHRGPCFFCIALWAVGLSGVPLEVHIFLSAVADLTVRLQQSACIQGDRQIFYDHPADFFVNNNESVQTDIGRHRAGVAVPGAGNGDGVFAHFLPGLFVENFIDLGACGGRAVQIYHFRGLSVNRHRGDSLIVLFSAYPADAASLKGKGNAGILRNAGVQKIGNRLSVGIGCPGLIRVCLIIRARRSRKGKLRRIHSDIIVLVIIHAYFHRVALHRFQISVSVFYRSHAVYLVGFQSAGVQGLFVLSLNGRRFGIGIAHRDPIPLESDFRILISVAEIIAGSERSVSVVGYFHVGHGGNYFCGKVASVSQTDGRRACHSLRHGSGNSRIVAPSQIGIIPLVVDDQFGYFFGAGAFLRNNVEGIHHDAVVFSAGGLDLNGVFPVLQPLDPVNL